MALLIRKTENLRKSDGSEITIDPNNLNDGVLIRFMPQGEFDGYGQTFFLRFYTALQFNQQNFGTINLVKVEEIDGVENRIEIPNSIYINKSLTELIQDYDKLAQAMPQMHPLMLFAYGYHKYIKEELEKIIGENSIEIRLDLM